MLEVILPLLCLAQSSDELAVLRFDPTTKSKSAFLTLQGSILQPTAAAATDSKFFAMGNQQPVRFVFGADIDGDMADEIAVLTEWTGNENGYRLSIHPRPDQLFDDVSTPKIKSKKGQIGSRNLFGAIVAADASNLDGAGADEIVLVRRTSNGGQRLEIYCLPDMKGAMTPALASFSDLGNAATDTILDVTGIDVDMDNADEIALLCRDAAGQVRVDVLRSPQSPADSVKLLLASARDGQQNGAIVGIDAIDADFDGHDELLITHAAVAGISKLVVFERPSGLSDTLKPLAGAQPIVLKNGKDAPIVEAFALRGACPKVSASGDLPPEALLQNEYLCTFEHDIPGGYLGATHVAMAPFVGAIGKFDVASKQFSLALPNGAMILGKFDTKSDTILNNGDPLKMSDPSLPSSMLSLNLSIGDAFVFGSNLVIQGSYSGIISGGSNPTTAVTNGVFSFSTMNH